MSPKKEVVWKRLRPAVPRPWLLLAAGLLWTSVGTFLCLIAGYWLSQMAWPHNGATALAGFAAGAFIYRYGFSHIARKNIRRIVEKPDRVCLFAFQAWQSYFLILLMSILGYTLRHSPMPRVVLSVVYAAIGTGLALSSALYYQELV